MFYNVYSIVKGFVSMEQRLILENDAGSRAVLLYNKGCNSCQSVLGAFQDELDIGESTAMKMGAGFGAGIGTMQKTCGALTGAMMVLGCRHYRENALFESKQIMFDETQKLLLRFHKKFGSTECFSLLKIDFHKPGGLQKARKQKIFETHCQRYLREVCLLLEENSHG